MPTIRPFSDDFEGEEGKELAKRLAARAPFSDIKQSVIVNAIQKHGRHLVCEPGDVLIRYGDWGSSAFFLLEGDVTVELRPGELVRPEVLGRGRTERKTVFDALRGLWSRSRSPERRDYDDGQVGVDGPDIPRVSMSDFPAVVPVGSTATISAPQVFGEQGALARTKRTATVFAETKCELVEMRWQGLRNIMRGKSGAQLRAKVDESYRRNGLAAFLRNSPYFRHVYDTSDPATKAQREEQQQRLETEADFVSHGDFDKVDSFRASADFGTASGLQNEPVIAHEGDYPNGIVLIRTGLARVSHAYHNGHRTVSYLTPGKAFGVETIAESARLNRPVPLRHSLRAIGYVTAIVIPTSLFEEIVKDAGDIAHETLPHFGDGSDMAPSDQSAGASATPGEQSEQSPVDSLPIDPGFLEFLVERRFVNGRETMLIDLDRCTRCDDCVRACAAAHDNNPRFLRHGPVHGKYMVANACMHCVDPVCMVDCPTGAIHRTADDGEVVINDLTCIGCASCRDNCWYDSIRMVPVANSSGSLIRRGKVGDGDPIIKATKCDLCDGQLTGPACQNACPHDAMVRLNIGEVTNIAQWVNR